MSCFPAEAEEATRDSGDLPAAAATRLTINGEPGTVAAGATPLDLLASLGYGSRPVAVEVNGEVVPRARLGERPLRDGDRLEIVTLVGGG